MVGCAASRSYRGPTARGGPDAGRKPTDHTRSAFLASTRASSATLRRSSSDTNDKERPIRVRCNGGADGDGRGGVMHVDMRHDALHDLGRRQKRIVVLCAMLTTGHRRMGTTHALLAR